MSIKQYLTGKLLNIMLDQMADQMADGTHPSVFDDPVAEKTEWMPLRKGGANFRTHKLMTVSAQHFLQS